MDIIRQPVIVVGVSGSLASATALRWAAEEAERRHGQLRIVLIWNPERRAPYAPPIGPQGRRLQRERAGQSLAATVRSVLGPAPRANVTTELVEGMAERALVDRSAGADLLVLGSASGFLAGRSIGPVIRTCLSRAHCPVVVVGPEGLHAALGGEHERQAAGQQDAPDPAAGLDPILLPGRARIGAAS